MQFAVSRIIIVRGSVDDWKKIRDRVEMILEYDLDWWTKRLLPICDGIIEMVAGKPNLEFWQHICKPKAIYGGEVITGWIADLFPYLKDGITNSPTSKNPILEKLREDYTRCKIAEINRFFPIFINFKDNRCIAFGIVRRKIGNFGDENYQT